MKASIEIVAAGPQSKDLNGFAGRVEEPEYAAIQKTRKSASQRSIGTRNAYSNT